MAPADVRTFAVDVTRSDRLTILLGPTIATGTLPDGRSLEITGSGRLLRIAFFGAGSQRKNYDVNLEELVSLIAREERLNDF